MESNNPKRKDLTHFADKQFNYESKSPDQMRKVADSQSIAAHCPTSSAGDDTF